MLTFNENSLNEMFGTITENVYAASGCKCNCTACNSCKCNCGNIDACRGCSFVPAKSSDWDNL